MTLLNKVAAKLNKLKQKMTLINSGYGHKYGGLIYHKLMKNDLQYNRS